MAQRSPWRVCCPRHAPAMSRTPIHAGLRRCCNCVFAPSPALVPQVRSLRMPSDTIRDVLEGVLLLMGQVRVRVCG